MSRNRFAIEGSRLWAWMLCTLIGCIAVIGFDIHQSMNRLDTASYRVWYRYSRYSEVQQLMTETQVLKLLGRPNRKYANPIYETWYYPIKPPISGFDTIYINYDCNGRITEITPKSVPKEQLFRNGNIVPGMKKYKVLKLMGRPRAADRSRCQRFWSYDLWNGACFQVMFDANGRVWRAMAVAHQVNLD